MSIRIRPICKSLHTYIQPLHSLLTPNGATFTFGLVSRSMSLSNGAGVIAQLQRHMAVIADQPFLYDKVFFAQTVSNCRKRDPLPRCRAKL